MVESKPGLKDELWDLEQKWERITDVPEPPRSLMNIVEYGLGSNRRAEEYINRLLRYFLDPQEPHGLQREFLKAFLEGLPDECDFDEDIHDISDTDVDEQVFVRLTADENPDGDTERTGMVDLVIETPGEWFLMVEIKFWAGENGVDSEGLSQTEFYYYVSERNRDWKDEHESGYHLYMHPSTESEAVEDEFANWTWESFLSDVFEEFVRVNLPRYPLRTVAQLREFSDDIQEITGMSDQQASEREQVELYLDHYDAIEGVRDTFNDRWERFAEEWGSMLGEALERESEADENYWNATVVDYDDLSEEVAVQLDEVDNRNGWTFVETSYGDADEEGNSDLWVFRATHPDWAHIFKYGWWKQIDALENRIDRDSPDARVGFVHRMERKRDLAIRDQTLGFNFRIMGANPQEFIDEFSERFDGREEEIRRLTPQPEAITGNKANKIKAMYDIPVEGHETFFEAYIAALTNGFREHAVGNEELVTEIDDLYDETIKAYKER
jgi:hypothetical protein